jgi:OmpA-OmpF porin, OOP family
MDTKQTLKIAGFIVMLFTTSMIFGCAHYERNTGRGGIPGIYIRSEMQDSDRALDSARQAGKDKICPAEFKKAEDARNNAYDVYRACHTEEGAALARKATALANALCPPQPAAAEAAPVPVPVPVPVVVPVEHYKYCITLQIEFDINQAVIRPQYRDEVAKVGDFMKKYPTTTAVIEGHTDNVGSPDYNMELSQRRAESVVSYLVENFGIDRSRLSAKGYGLTRPIADNDTNAGKQKNRRIEAIIDCAFDVTKIEPPERLCMTLVIDYDTNKADIKPQYRDEIAKVADYLKKYPTTTALIEGHTDNVGNPEYNMKLSQQRADNVVNYLVENFGIDRSRLSAKGYGDTRRISYDDTAQGRAKNRRIDAVIDCVITK